MTEVSDEKKVLTGCVLPFGGSIVRLSHNRTRHRLVQPSKRDDSPRFLCVPQANPDADHPDVSDVSDRTQHGNGRLCVHYLKANATIDAQYDTVMCINGAWVYQADASRAFDHWQTLSLNSNYSAHSIHAAATGYVYFVGDYGMKDKYYLTIDHTWAP